MSHWSDDPAQVEERAKLAEAAIGKINEGLAEYLVAIGDSGDAEVLQNAIVFYESAGIDASDGKQFSRPSHVVTAFEGSRTQMIGLLTLETPSVVQALMSGRSCGHDHE